MTQLDDQAINDDDARVLRRLWLEHQHEAEPLYAFPLKGGGWWPLDDGLLGELAASFPHVDLDSELRRAWAWVAADERRKKTARGMRRYLTGWLARVD